jgi:hypothetical protein
MEKTQAGFIRYPRNSGRAQDDRTVKWRAVDGKLLLDLGKRAVYSSRIDAPSVNLKVRDIHHRAGVDRGLTSSYSRAG